MPRCGCANEICACVIHGEGDITVSGAGTDLNPYVVKSQNLGLTLQVQDTTTVDLTLTGAGSPTDPYLLKADAAVGDTASTLEWRQTGITAAAWPVPNVLTLVPFTVNNGGNGISLDGSGRMVVPKGGVHHVVATLTLTAGAATNTFAIFQLIQRRAGAAVATREVVAYTDGTNKFDMAAVAGDFATQTGDTFEVLAQAQAAGIITLSASRSHFAGHRLAGPGADGAPGPAGSPGPAGPSGITDLPVGTILMWPGPTAPTNWVLCDGRSLLRTDFPDLFTAVGGAASVWGLPDSTHFNVPNMKGRFPLASGGAWPVAQALGNSQHGHVVPGHVHTTAGNSTAEDTSAVKGTGLVLADTAHTHQVSNSGNQNANAVANNSLPPYLVLNFIILTRAV